MAQQQRLSRNFGLKQELLKRQLLQHPNLWRAGQLAEQQRQTRQGIATGFAELDRHLPGQGWPQGGLMELMPASAGIGELRLLAPALATLSHTEMRWIVWINPPFIPYAPALKNLGIDINKILLIHPKTHQEALWALERAAKSGTCSAVLAWVDAGANDKLSKRPKLAKLTLRDTQRIQVAAKQGRTLTCLVRPAAAQRQSSMAELRLALKPTAQTGSVCIDICKRRGGWPVSDVHLAIDEATGTRHPPLAEIREQLSLWREARQAIAGSPDAVTLNPQWMPGAPKNGESTVRLH